MLSSPRSRGRASVRHSRAAQHSPGAFGPSNGSDRIGGSWLGHGGLSVRWCRGQVAGTTDDQSPSRRRGTRALVSILVSPIGDREPRHRTRSRRRSSGSSVSPSASWPTPRDVSPSEVTGAKALLTSMRHYERVLAPIRGLRVLRPHGKNHAPAGVCRSPPRPRGARTVAAAAGHDAAVPCPAGRLSGARQLAQLGSGIRRSRRPGSRSAAPTTCGTRSRPRPSRAGSPRSSCRG